MARVYKKGEPNSEYDAYHSSSEQKKRRAQRNAARRAALRKGTVKKGDDLEVDHLGSNRKGPLNNKKTKVVSKKKNRKRQPKRDGSED